MGGSLLAGEEFRATTFHVIDFEATTPRGYRPEPIEVAVISLSLRGAGLAETARFTGLMCPPGHAPVGPLDTSQTGITPKMVATAPTAAEVLAELDTRVASSGPQLLVAHHAPTEAGILYDYRKYCPQLAATDLLDTVRLSRVLYPDLHSHGLDVVRGHLKIPPPRNRHRALPDTQLTAQIFQHLMEDGSRAGTWSSLQQVRKLGGYQARANQPYQEALFE